MAAERASLMKKFAYSIRLSTAPKISNSENLSALGHDEGLQCTTSSTNLNFSDCHSEEIVENKAFFIANFLVVILFGGSANLITVLALPYVRLR